MTKEEALEELDAAAYRRGQAADAREYDPADLPAAALEYARTCGWMPFSEVEAHARGYERMSESNAKAADRAEARVKELESVMQRVCDQLTSALLVREWDAAKPHVTKACEILRKDLP